MLSLQELSARLSAPALRRGIAADLTAAALAAEAQAKRNATTAPRVRSGRLRASIRSLVDVQPGRDFWELRLQAGGGRGEGAEVVYARLQEQGGIIVPKRRKFLAIPLAPARTAAGVSRYKTPRDVPDLEFRRSKAGNYLLVKRDTGEPWYVLRKRVEVPARPYLRPALDDAAQRLAQALGATLTEVLA